MTSTPIKDSSKISGSYTKLLHSLKEKISSSQIKAAVSVNGELACQASLASLDG